MNSDATGRAFRYETLDGDELDLEDVDPNGYGLGVGMDEFGRPVDAEPRLVIRSLAIGLLALAIGQREVCPDDLNDEGV